MRAVNVLAVIVGLSMTFGVAAFAEATGNHYTLELIKTQNAPPDAQATMTLTVDNGTTVVNFAATGLYPNTLYTIWTAFSILVGPPFPADGTEVPSIPATTRPGFPPDGNGVSPLGRMDAAFTSGMGQDPGGSFVTDDKGNGTIWLELDYDLIEHAPVSNGGTITQCVPGPISAGNCPPPSKVVRITGTWLRKFIGNFSLAERATKCENYSPIADPDSPQYDQVASRGMNAKLWQCVNPVTHLPRVYRFDPDHFRLANHPDDLTHGFIGGSTGDHLIEMVGRVSDLVSTGD